MAVRNKRSCNNCPRPKPTPAEAKQPLSVTVAEGLRLWKHVLFGTTTCAQMIAGYARLGLPGDPRDGIKSIIKSLQATLEELETRDVPTESPSERPTLASEDHNPPSEGGDIDDARRQPQDDESAPA